MHRIVAGCPANPKEGHRISSKPGFLNTSTGTRDPTKQNNPEKQGIRIRIQRLCGPGLGIRFPDPDPGARKVRNFSGKMHFIVILNNNFTTKKV
jgi:hypothetical protein